MRQRWIPLALAVAAVYIAVGIGFAPYTRWTNPQHAAWRFAAWVICALAYAVQISIEQWRFGSSPFFNALHCAIAAALGGLALGIAIGRASAIIAFPFAVGIPAFVVALIISALFRALRGTTDSRTSR